MRKANEEGRDPHLALLEYRNTPVSGLSYSPAQLLMSRMLRDKMPTRASLLVPKVADNAYTLLKSGQQKQKQYYDRVTKKLPELKVGDCVRVRLGRTWTPGIISSKHNTPRSYLVTTESGGEYRRNRRVINRTPEPLPDVSPSFDDFGIPPETTANKVQQASPQAPTAPPAPD